MAYGSTVLVSYPSTLAVSLEDMKAHCRVDISTDDDYLTALIRTATRFAEGYTRRQFLNATYKKSVDYWGGWQSYCNDTAGVRFPLLSSRIYLDYPPLVSVQSITYVDSNGVTQTWASSNYQVITEAHIGFVYSTSAPIHAWQPNGIQINYTAGYGSAASALPWQAVQAIKMLAAHWYENREPQALGTIATSLQFAVEALLDQIKVAEVAT